MFDEVAKLETIKELRDAGFPLKPATMGTDAARISSYQYDGIWLYPTLEELIEACESRFSELHSYSDGMWQAKSRGMSASEEGWYDVMGSTPTKAVKRLWLALNKTTGRCLCGQVPCPTCRGEDITKLKLNKNGN